LILPSILSGIINGSWMLFSCQAILEKNVFPKNKTPFDVVRFWEQHVTNIYRKRVNPALQ